MTKENFQQLLEEELRQEKAILQAKADLKNAVDLLIDCVSDEYKKEILDVYKTHGKDRRRAQKLYKLIDKLFYPLILSNNRASNSFKC